MDRIQTLRLDPVDEALRVQLDGGRSNARLDLLEPSTLASLTSGNELAIDWEHALCLKELLEEEDDGRRSVLEKDLPDAWTSDDRVILCELIRAADLPLQTPLRLEVRALGVYGQAGYRLDARWLAEGRRVLREGVTRDGGLVAHGGGKPRRLTLGQYRVLQGIEAATNLGTDRRRDIEVTGLVVGSVPVGDDGVVLDPFLANESFSAIDRVEPKLRPVANGYQVRPHVESLPDEAVEEYFYRTPERELGSRPLRAMGEAGARTNAVFTDRAERGLAKARELDHLTPEQTAHALSHPADVFGEDLDLSAFSERVTGLGPDIRRVFPVLKEIPSQKWWDWDMVVERTPDSIDDEPSAGPEFSLKDPEIREKVENSIAQADAGGDVYIPHPTEPAAFIPVTPGLRQAVAAAKTLAARGNTLTERPRLVLQVQENLEDIVFDRSAPPPITPEKLAYVPPPGLLPGFALKPYQQEGVAWLRNLVDGAKSSTDWRGALLADDMGLGKTLVVLSALAHLRAEGRAGPHLVIAPLTLLDNWEREARRFFGSTFEPVLLAHGDRVPFHDLAAARSRMQAQCLVLTTYDTVRRQEWAFASVDWDILAMDEAQKAKDPSTQVARVVRTLKARFRLAMTGTPVENSLKELWTIYDWTNPGLLGSLRQFADRFIKPIREAAAGVMLSLSRDLASTIRPFFLRRIKRDVLAGELPPINPPNPPDPPNAPIIHTVPLSQEQNERYREIVGSVRPEKAAVLGTIIRLFGTLAHPDLGAALGRRPVLGRWAEKRFARADALFGLLDDISAKGEKAVVFANRIALQEWLANEVAERYDTPTPIINGEVSDSRARLDAISRFSERSGFGAMILAPRAAGVGLNIVAANHVIHYTREWNPAVEDQATDRTYRIGQTRSVHVHAFVGTHPGLDPTVDRRLADLLSEKRRLAREFVVPMGALGASVDELAASVWR